MLTILAPDSLAARFFGGAVKRASIIAVPLMTGPPAGEPPAVRFVSAPPSPHH